MARLDGVTAHVFRHTFGSIAGELGYSELTIAAMLGHGKRSVTQGYIHIDELLRSAIETVSERVMDLLDGRRKTVRDPLPRPKPRQTAVERSAPELRLARA